MNLQAVLMQTTYRLKATHRLFVADMLAIHCCEVNRSRQSG